jgi:uncharacterized protein DUF3667
MTSETSADSMLAAPADAAGTVEAVDARCRNCGARTSGSYCANCGQETALALPSAGTFLREAAGRYVAFDGRMWRSLHALLFRPGFLTREYFAGRRRRYVRPARLFVALSIAFFAVLRLASQGPAILDRNPPGVPAGGEPQGATKPADRRSDGFDIRIDEGHRLRIDTGGRAWLGPFAERLEAFDRLPGDERARQMRTGMLRHAPYAAIALLPLFALMLKLLYAGSSRRHPARPHRYAAHLVFGAHLHAFAFLAAMLYALVHVSAIRAVIAIWMIAYGLIAMKVVYGGRWPGVALRALVIALAYLLFFGLAVAALVVAAVALR